MTWRLLEVPVSMRLFYFAFPSTSKCVSLRTCSQLIGLSLLGPSPWAFSTADLYEVAPPTENLRKFRDPQSSALPSEREIATHLPVSTPLPPSSLAGDYISQPPSQWGGDWNDACNNLTGSLGIKPASSRTLPSLALQDGARVHVGSLTGIDPSGYHQLN